MADNETIQALKQQLNELERQRKAHTKKQQATKSPAEVRQLQVEIDAMEECTRNVKRQLEEALKS